MSIYATPAQVTFILTKLSPTIILIIVIIIIIIIIIIIPGPAIH